MNLRRHQNRLRHGCLAAAGALMLGIVAGGATTGAEAAPAGWHTSGAQILDPSGRQFVITGINWYGFETNGYVAQGMYAKDYRYIVDEVKRYGYNTIRIPFSNAMWETDPVPRANTISACPSCKGTHSRDILANIINYAGSIGLHVILDNHRSTAGNSAEKNGLWYVKGSGSSFPESAWVNDWRHIQQWLHGTRQTQGASDTVRVDNRASDGFPTVLGYELRNEPHTPPRTAYLQGATWGTGDGISPTASPSPNPFAPACVATSTCHDWRLAAERAGDLLLGDATTNGWEYPLILVNGISQYPTARGTAAGGPYDYYWWGGDLQGVNGNAGNPGAPVLLNAGGSASGLGAAVGNQLVYTAHDFGPAEYQQGYFNARTCYKTGCSDSSLADVWNKYWAYIDVVGGVHPQGSTSPYTQAPILISEFGTGNSDDSLVTTGNGSQGQWFTDMVNFIQSSYTSTSTNASGVPVTDLNWTYWALNTEDGYSLLGSGYTGLANPDKEYSFLCTIQRPPFAVASGSSPACGSTGPLPGPG